MKIIENLEEEKNFRLTLLKNNSYDFKLYGELGLETRSQKVNRYLRKKMRRKWSKKINYHSRKKVADTRPRFKGRFVSVDQADEFNEKLRKSKANE